MVDGNYYEAEVAGEQTMPRSEGRFGGRISKISRQWWRRDNVVLNPDGGRRQQRARRGKFDDAVLFWSGLVYGRWTGGRPDVSVLCCLPGWVLPASPTTAAWPVSEMQRAKRWASKASTDQQMPCPARRYTGLYL